MIYGIAANGLNAPQHTGVERYLEELLREMLRLPLQTGDRVLLYVAQIPKGFAELPAGWGWRVLPFGKGWTHLRLSWELLCHPPDVLFNPSHELPFAVSPKTKIVFTVHDLAFRRLPAMYAPSANRRQRWAIQRAVKKSAMLLAVSQTTKRDLVELYRVPQERVLVTTLGVDAKRFEIGEDTVQLTMDKYRLARGRYLLYLGRLEAKKNVVTLLRGFAELKRTLGVGHPLSLVAAGSFGFGKERILEALREYGNDVLLPGFVADEDVPGLMRGALAFCFPSHYEGFGLPVLEAFAAGAPVIASDIAAFHEVAGEAALFASPTAPGEWAQAMYRVVFEEDTRAKLAAQGSERVKDFTWKKTAAATWQALRTTANTYVR